MAAARPPAQGEFHDLYVDLAVDLRVGPDVEPDVEPDVVIDLTQPLRHASELVESGSFTRARCGSCAWAGPARRARAIALADAQRHETSGAP
ncbi:MAG: hypothetical protein ACJ71T_13885 [Actinomycetales bacterium]